MKKRVDPRHLLRRKTVKDLFAFSFKKIKAVNFLTRKVIVSLPEIDKKIENCASEWPIGQINKLDLAVLRLAVWELFTGKTAPAKVIINEAVELAKRYGSKSSPGFVNGVLGTILTRFSQELSLQELARPEKKKP